MTVFFLCSLGMNWSAEQANCWRNTLQLIYDMLVLHANSFPTSL